jgi:hypothetical protein
MLVNDRHLYIPYLALSHVRYAVVSLVTDVSEDRTLLLLFNPDDERTAILRNTGNC